MRRRHPSLGFIFAAVAAVLIASAPVRGQQGDDPVDLTDPIRIYVFADAERTDVPDGWNQSGQSYSGTVPAVIDSTQSTDNKRSSRRRPRGCRHRDPPPLHGVGG